MKLLPPPFLLAGGLSFGLGLAAVFFGEDGHAAPCEDGGDCPPCPDERFCYDPAAARAAKAAKKAAAIAHGLPERLAKAFDEIADCVGCVETSPDWPHLVVEMDADGWEEKKGRPPPYRWISSAWDAAGEKQARDMMREGLVKSIRIILARYPCRCCPTTAEEIEDWRPDDPSYWEDQDGWNDDFDIHEDVVVDEVIDPDDIGPDPPDLTNLPEERRRPPVDLQICGGDEAPKVPHITVSCTLCMPIKDEHDQYADRINEAQVRLRELRRDACILDQEIAGIWDELYYVDRLADTPETAAQTEALYSELAAKKEARDQNRQETTALEAEIPELERKRQETIARIIDCEEKCRVGVEPPLDDLPPTEPFVEDDVGAGEPPAYEEPEEPEREPEAGEPRPATDFNWTSFNPRTLRANLRYVSGQYVAVEGSPWDDDGDVLAPVQARDIPGGAVLFIAPDLTILATSLGSLGNDAVEVRLFGGEPGAFSFDGLVLEPVELDEEAKKRLAEELANLADQNPITAKLDAYCLDFLRAPPDLGQVFRIASAEIQRRFSQVRGVLHAGRRLHEMGLLNPDSDPEEYFHSIRQWALWSVQEKLDLGRFGEAFVKHTRENFESAGEPWTGQVESLVRGLVPNRWKDITKIIDEARGSGAATGTTD